MAAYSPDTQSPLQIVTVEQNLVHGASMYSALTPESIQYAIGQPARAWCRCERLYFPDNNAYIYIEAAVPLIPDWQSSSALPWMQAAENPRTATVSAGFKRA